MKQVPWSEVVPGDIVAYDVGIDAGMVIDVKYTSNYNIKYSCLWFHGGGLISPGLVASNTPIYVLR